MTLNTKYYQLIKVITLSALISSCTSIFGKEEQLTVTQLPAPISKLALEKTEGYEIVGVEKETYRDNVIYSVNYLKNGEEWEVEFDPSGSIISHELE